LFTEGKKPEEIAAERGFAISTIDKHLTEFIETGKIDATQLVDKERINTIVTVAQALDTFLLRPIKDLIGDEYSFSELNFAMADYKFELSKQNEKKDTNS